MNKIGDLSTGAVILLIVVLVIQIYLYYESDEIDRLDSLDFNKDGIITRKELKYYLILLENQKKKKSIKLHDIKKNILSGFVRGLLMGLILNNFEGGITLGITLSILNPLISSTEKTLF
jgi:hypothetical protein